MEESSCIRQDYLTAPQGSLQILQYTKHIPVVRNVACVAIRVLLIWQRIYVRWYGSRLTIVPLESHVIHQAEFPGLFNNSYTKCGQLVL